MRYFGLEFILVNAKKLYLKLLISLTLTVISISTQAATYSLSQGNPDVSLMLYWSGVASEVRISEYIKSSSPPFNGGFDGFGRGSARSNGSYVRIYKASIKNGSLKLIRGSGLHTIKFDSCYKTWYFRTKCSSSIKSITLDSSVSVTASTNSIPGSIDISWTGLNRGPIPHTLEVSKNGGSWVLVSRTASTSYTQNSLSSGSYQYRVSEGKRPLYGPYRSTQSNAGPRYSFLSNNVIISSPKTIFIHTDLLGTPVAETDINGDLL
jgi:hypothetical protein